MPPPLTLHVAHFYEDDEFLVESLVNFVKAGLQNDETVIIIATAPHVHSLRHALTSADLCNPRLSCFDATTLLSQLMVEEEKGPDQAVFMRLVGRPIQEACHKGRVRVWGEMVSVLWRTGQYQAALCLEGLWNTLQSTQSFTLWHAYPHMSYSPGADPMTMLDLYHAHSHVLHQNTGSPSTPC